MEFEARKKRRVGREREAFLERFEEGVVGRLGEARDVVEERRAGA